MAGLNRPLLWGGTLSLLAAFLHIAIIIGGPAWYRLFGAGEQFARLAEQGSPLPDTMTAVIALILLLWSLYAFAGAGLVHRLPWLKSILMLITAVYLIRGMALLPLALFMPQAVDSFLILSSLICMVIGMLHFSGTRQMIWELS
ncbi:MAG: hypothetical protein N0E58_07025 [Candidatus Thiodiazotropha endolucinida]|uniref:Uncharacterized protein n=1 Tax=Candidatus Thiodiazotropha taylori TaxID=2792791 RepID=A0A9E4TS41_9GAMM|nr:hypothetical protein [Candidatus Thiodiazotropha sp. (ex Codakia orbicularis)]MBV2125118.1 hypothetical protein [Candidatus Thiodiazotropha taylori]MCG7977875.1 hypothetical protein [Candidatus Thiodiazotropha taylori]MCW4236002.1 hypothetical protein [Candidatus Thiodiazotropha endolucinida]